MTSFNSQGYQSQLGIDTANPITQGFEFDSCTIAKAGNHVDASGLRGSRSHRSERVRDGNYSVAGTIIMRPSPEDLALLLPWILGVNASGTTYALAETLQDRYITLDKVAKVYTWDHCLVNKATFSGSEGQDVQLALDIIGFTETEADAGSFPSGMAAPTYSNTAPFLFTDCSGAFSMVGAARAVKRFSLTIDNALDPSYYNSRTLTHLTPRDRVVSVSCQNPFTSAEVDLYNQAVAGSAATFTFTYAGYSLAFALAKLQVPPKGPQVGGRQEIPLMIDGIARMDGDTKELIVTLDSTP